MKSFVIALFICVFCVQIGKGQTTLGDYNYVVVPDQFEFLKGKDQYQANSLTVWLLKKAGFNAYLDSQLPLYLRKLPCRGLKAEVIAQENFLWLKTWVVFTDCNGKVLYTSDEGRSKEKDYRKVNQEAIRLSFESITALGIVQPVLKESDVVPARVVNTPDSGGISSGGTPVVAVSDAGGDISSGGAPRDGANPQLAKVTNTVTTNADTQEVVKPELMETTNMSDTDNMIVSEDLSKYAFKEYLLVPSENYYHLMYQGAVIGKASPTSQAGIYEVETNQFVGTAYKEGNTFVIERVIQGMDQKVKMIFTKQ